MLLCPACGSSRIRNDYQPAPILLRMFGIRALLCDHCNHQFKAFSPRAPKSRAPRHSKRNADVFNPAPVVDLSRLQGEVVQANGTEMNGQSNGPRRLTIDLAALRLQSRQQEEVIGTIVIDQVSPVRRDLRTEITKLYAQGAKEPSRQLNSAADRAASDSPPDCAHCGSSNVKRRHRSLMERVAFSATDHKAFACRSCGESFYARSDGDKLDPKAMVAAQGAR